MPTPPANYRWGKNEFAILDLGAILANCAADMARTVYLGQPSRGVGSLYNAFAEAQAKFEGRRGNSPRGYCLGGAGPNVLTPAPKDRWIVE
jgi:hypothetical protein